MTYESSGARLLRSVTRNMPHVWSASRGWHVPETDTYTWRELDSEGAHSDTLTMVASAEHGHRESFNGWTSEYDAQRDEWHVTTPERAHRTYTRNR